LSLDKSLASHRIGDWVGPRSGLDKEMFVDSVGNRTSTCRLRTHS